MACEKKEFNISGREVTIVQWPASTAVKKLRLVLDTFKGDAVPLIQDEWDFMTVLRCQREEQVFDVLKDLVSSDVFISGSEVNEFTFDKVFTGDLLFIWQVISKVLEVNFKDFFTKGFELRKQEQTT